MRAASHIGRIGGLAVALGVGTAILTGAGVAHATEGDDSGTGAPAGQESGGGTTTAVKKNDSGSPGRIDSKPPRPSDTVGRHRADDTTPNSNATTSIVKRPSDPDKRASDAIENAAGAANTVVRPTTNTGDSSLQDRNAARKRAGARVPATETLTTGGMSQTNNFVSNQFVNRTAAVKDWIASPRALAGRSVDATPTVSERTPLWTPAQALAPLGPTKTTPGTGATAVRTTTLLTSVLSALNPFAGNAPGSPAGGADPLSLVVAGAARREIGVESLAPTAILAPSTDSLTYDPDIDFVRGVIGGINAPVAGVTYLVVSQPSGGGKVYVDPTSGNFTFLPDLSTVRSGGTESFRVVAAETTPFTTALTSIPLVGGLVDQVLIVLYQIPVANELLAPIIGRSQITEVPISVSQWNPNGTPMAFTVMVPSNGAMISTNYFPAWSVADGTYDDAPTILNGPGLATAGNINPTATNTVDGLVPGIDELTSKGFNVVTWDPRGEFDSTGTLELDSPQYEGQDVSNIITWITDNPNYTHPSFEPVDVMNPAGPKTDDPWIGMVGGSYGGGIQLVAAAGDNRVDVIVPGIAWNTLNSSLYPGGAFKTSYSALLLLGLVTAGARINPQIYGGIITGAVLGILTPDQQALLERSGPGQTVRGIGVPTLFIQGTVDVLFPLQQALINAELLADQSPVPPISMIWYCGGHGVCLNPGVPLDKQNQVLLNNTIAWLDNALPEADGTPDDTVPIPKFQWVDQNGDLWKADALPTSGSAFFGTELSDLVDPNAAGNLVLVPIVGGSGPQSAAGFPASLGMGTPATNAITVPIHADIESGTTYVVGSPELSFDYSGIGTSRHVYAQIVDTKTQLVVGNIVTPVDVTLNGTQQTAHVNMEDIAWTYTLANKDDLELQIVGSATPYENFTQFGYMSVSNVQLTLPTAGAGANVMHEDWPAVQPPPVLV